MADTEHAAGDGDPDIEQNDFLEQVRAALTDRDAVPQRVREAGYAAFAWRTVDSELAELLYDSAVSDLAGAGSRSDQATVRAMTFSGEQTTFELEINGDEVLGQVVPALAGEVVVIVGGVAGQRVEVAEVGRFRVHGIPREPFKLRFDGTDGTTVTTGVITP